MLLVRVFQVLLMRALLRSLPLAAFELLRLALLLGAALALFGLLFAPFSGWGPFAGPSLLAGCREASLGATGPVDAVARLGPAYLRWTSMLLIICGVVGLPLGALSFSFCIKPPSDKTVRDFVGLCLMNVAIGWLLAIFLALSPC